MTDRKRVWLGFVLLILTALACNTTTSPTANTVLSKTPAITKASIVSITDLATTPLSTRIASPTATASPAPATEVPLPTPSVMLPSTTPLPTKPTIAYDGPGCIRPPDNYDRIEVNGETLNARTLEMLQQAASLYAGPGDLLRVTQGGYTTGETISFGTHAGGGAVDISIRNPANPSEILWDETDAMVLALRRAGFAAWYRAPGDLGPGSPAHIHAIAIGDRELSPAALEQLTGPGGYFRGFDGLPPEYGGPHQDLHGGPIICPWMIEMGYPILEK